MENTPPDELSPFTMRSASLSHNADNILDNTRKHKNMDRESGLATPQVAPLHPSQMLISPPPEEFLRGSLRHLPAREMSPSLPRSRTAPLASKPKRKRAQVPTQAASASPEGDVDAEISKTPNPKPRKLSKRQADTRLASQSSPTRPRRRANSTQPNPGASARRTPVPRISHTDPVSPTRAARYSPPRERFTPPREVLLESPTKSKSTAKPRQRKSHAAGSASARKSEAARVKVYVKKECPEIDLTRPPPPPSPTEDPLLLRGRPGKGRGRMGGMSLPLSPEAAGGSSAQPIVLDEDEDVQPALFAHDSTPAAFTPQPQFDFTSLDAASGDDSDMGEEGEYTGKYTMMTVPTKDTDGAGEGGSPYPAKVALQEDVEMEVEVDVRVGVPQCEGPVVDDDSAMHDNVGEEPPRVVPDRSRTRSPSPSPRPSQFHATRPQAPLHDADADIPADTEDLDSPEPHVHRSSSPRTSELGDDPVFAQSDDFLRDVEVGEEGRQEEEEEDSFRKMGNVGGREETVSTEPVDESAQPPLSRPIDPQPPNPLPDPLQTPLPLPADIQPRAPSPPPEDDLAEEEDAVANMTMDGLIERMDSALADGEDWEAERTVDGILGRMDGVLRVYRERRRAGVGRGGRGDRDRRKSFPGRALRPGDPSWEEEEGESGRVGYEDTDEEEEEMVDRELSSDPVQSDEDEQPPPSPDSPPTSFEPDHLHQPRQSTSANKEVGHVLPRERAATPEFLRAHKDKVVVGAAYGESDGEESEETDESVVKVVSTDPRAAARAAAILKMHDYEWLPKPLKANRSRLIAGDYLKSIRRKSVGASGVRKSSERKGVLGDRVYIPGSPVVSVGELLREAEGEVSVLEQSHLRDTKLREKSRSQEAVSKGKSKDREKGGWSKDDWKLLDACFTDEREERGVGADAVRAEDVVRRYLALVGHAEPDKAEWAVLVARANALRRKQREGRGAPGTPVVLKSFLRSAFQPSVSASASGAPMSPWVDVPEFTPLPRKFADRTRDEERLERPRLAAAVFGRSYKSLLEEARKVADGEQGAESIADVSVESTAESNGDLSTRAESDTSVTSAPSPSPPPAPKPASRPSFGGRVKGLLFSYLPTLSKKPEPAKQHKPAAPGIPLPLPPPEVLNKPRGPVSTPGPKPVPRAAAPKVPLKEVEKAKASRIPVRRREEPKRMVELRSVGLPEERGDTSVSSESSGRRSSAGSVRDLKAWFEERERAVREEEEKRRAGLRKGRV
ncbi:hypothetical protein GLOTRDRAFT_139717 [Gloeophyllum trabeum ATCC 11539]|uniref:Uncharacterized protein n=1 Tax=Gloeophyllum trabeum (strain ATCC 11539 / FP-39264 / Madison 617) TaxID=670483 RepID=S7RH10_GLOTA|nr:uncharacterized protein GLOTRDRAFT_139717 [Gloeophyllum trabeum ATCC 11539]EPQ53490.1 hypothetical protein GLOTRDRAFT_139717 [Gloeophyllum trabeum ATCC 11539]